MIPQTNEILIGDFEIDTLPSKAYKMHLDSKIVNGFTDEIDAVKQAAYVVLNTERYEHIIYSDGYGIELSDLYGEPVSYVCPELERRVTEALMQDDRILEVGNFSFDTSKKRAIHVFLTVDTIFGDFDMERVVDI